MEVLQDAYKDTKIGRILKDWEVTQLASVCDIIMGQSPSSESYNEDSIGLPLVQGNADIKSRITKPRIYTSQITKISEVDDIIMTVRAPVGAIAKSNIKSCIGRGVCALRVKSIDNEFLYQMLIEKETSWIRLEQGSTFSAVNSKDIKTFKIALPPLPEQQKIAAILSTVDEQISITDKIIEKSKELKKGLMQKLFSEGIGHTEFKDTKIGRIPKDWEVVKIGDLTKIKVGRDLKEDSFSEIKTETHKYPVFSNTVSNNGFYGGYYNFAEHKGRSLTIVGRGVGIGTSFSRGGGYGAIGRLLVLFPNEDVNEVFMSNYVNFKMTIHYEDGGIPQLTGNKIATYKVAKPLLPEQQKIAAILSEADAKIEKEQTQKAQLEQLKKGLMQQLLTGKKRVKV
jgi:type I restriction enzyme S subunit